MHAWLDSALSYPDGERNDAGTLMTMAAEELIAHGHGDQAGPVLVRAIQFYRTLPAQQTDFYDRLDLARTLLFAERLEEAESVALSLATGDADQLAIGTGLLGAIAARRGDRIEAEAHIARIDSLSATLSRPLEIGPYWQAQIRAWLGDNDEAIRLLRQTFGPQGRDLHEALEFRPLADDPDFQELQRPKG